MKDVDPSAQLPVSGSSQRRGRSRARVHYFGQDVFAGLWSGDTRTMIQLISDVVDHASEAPTQDGDAGSGLSCPSTKDCRTASSGTGEANGCILIPGNWSRRTPRRFREELAITRSERPGYKLSGEYGDHLKAVVEAFAAAATALLGGPTYTIVEKRGKREVPRMAFTNRGYRRLQN